MSSGKKLLLQIYFIICALFVLDCLLYYFNEISLRGYYSDVILSWLWLISNFVVIIVFWKKLLAKLLLVAITITFAISIMAMMMPFFALLLSSTSLGLYQNKDLNKNYRAQIVGYSAMGRPWLEVIEKKGLFEKRIVKFTDSQLMNDNLDIKIRTAKDIIFRSETNSTLTLTLFYGGPNRTITFDKSTGNIIAIKEL
ncbi:hypothetical protein [Flavobacterium sharifuzzamanii]|uniref:hypothetical protein n=1 Tax=Flavobacterium sharifuzzamanii TaxID=2211133 RepID=UPI000DAB411D|nr:hypothetical protein [Flavobacterium sharifuzzamanii]KAF2080280.1 hypothetical protein DMA14_13345 [Flavobacterium sharifuzzamanii]